MSCWIPSCDDVLALDGAAKGGAVREGGCRAVVVEVPPIGAYKADNGQGGPAVAPEKGSAPAAASASAPATVGPPTPAANNEALWGGGQRACRVHGRGSAVEGGRGKASQHEAFGNMLLHDVDLKVAVVEFAGEREGLRSVTLTQFYVGAGGGEHGKRHVYVVSVKLMQAGIECDGKPHAWGHRDLGTDPLGNGLFSLRVVVVSPAFGGVKGAKDGLTGCGRHLADG
ncbi:hypothetical protein DFH07DRAFT_786002 [Mycena maculata]|uniref:Uncharacterized protein n=1 Tax=Mycena maculata TaxID=230809 RepID=A0AAD7H5C1_9AGAR|nr:hypothetical protein DFH07DRAFT_786002 [Mycena maculata]